MRGLLILSNFVEDMEALGTRDLLKRAGIEIVTATFETSLQIITSYGLHLKADDYAQNITIDGYDFLIIPGGPYVGKVVDQDRDIKELVRDFYDQGKLVTAICAGPRFLGQIGLLDGKHYTAFHGSNKDALKGYYHPEEKVVIDGRIITARGAGVIYDFAYEITKYLLSEEKAKEVQKNMMF
jgi:4-methyl-5(b-hydroxyethyl)-thiazole monophosphate biosynthesis